VVKNLRRELLETFISAFSPVKIVLVVVLVLEEKPSTTARSLVHEGIPAHLLKLSPALHRPRAFHNPLAVVSNLVVHIHAGANMVGDD
jgi:hypothetical protein